MTLFSPKPIAEELAADIAVKQHFADHDGEELYPDDVADALGLGLFETIDACERLADKGRIART